MTLRPWIARTLWSGGASLGIALVSGLLSVVLRALGDHNGGESVRGVALVAVTGLVLSLVVLVVLLAVTEVLRENPPDEKDDQALD